MKRILNDLYKEGRRDEEFDYVIEMFRIFNEHIVKGLPVEFVTRSIERNALRKETLDKLDYRLLNIIKRCHDAGKMTGILSAGFVENISAVLQSVGHGFTFDFYEANILQQQNGKAIGFDLSIYRKKFIYLQELLIRMNIDARAVVYIGDSEDDAECFECVGYPVLSLLAAPELKEEYARKYRAFAPENERDLAAYLGVDD